MNQIDMIALDEQLEILTSLAEQTLDEIATARAAIAEALDA